MISTAIGKSWRSYLVCNDPPICRNATSEIGVELFDDISRQRPALALSVFNECVECGKYDLIARSVLWTPARIGILNVGSLCLHTMQANSNNHY